MPKKRLTDINTERQEQEESSVWILEQIDYLRIVFNLRVRLP